MLHHHQLILMTNLNRSPFQNDLITEPSQSAILHESSQFSADKPFQGEAIGFSFDWMLSIPICVAVKPTLMSVTKPSVLITLPVPDLTPFQFAEEKEYVVGTIHKIGTWASIAFSWHEMVRRKISVSAMCVKCFSPGKLQVDMSYTSIGSLTGDPLDVNDIFGRRNITMEFDVSEQRIHTIVFPVIYPIASKKSSYYVSSKVNADGFVNQALPDWSVSEGSLSITQPLQFQIGMLYPNTFNIYVWYCYSGTSLHTITSPSLCALPSSGYDAELQPLGGYVVPRWIPGLFHEAIPYLQ